MANANTPFGLKPARNARSGRETGGLEMFYVPASDGTALYIGDPVIKNGSADGAGIAGVVRAAATGAITGVVMGFVPDGVTDQAPGERGHCRRRRWPQRQPRDGHGQRLFEALRLCAGCDDQGDDQHSSAQDPRAGADPWQRLRRLQQAPSHHQQHDRGRVLGRRLRRADRWEP
jgi:hypothetical protein